MASMQSSVTPEEARQKVRKVSLCAAIRQWSQQKTDKFYHRGLMVSLPGTTNWKLTGLAPRREAPRKHTGNGQEIVKLNETRKREAEGILIEGGCTTYNH